jgi:hypothetical protein
MDATRYFIVSGLPLCVVSPTLPAAWHAAAASRANHQSDYDPFDEL